MIYTDDDYIRDIELHKELVNNYISVFNFLLVKRGEFHDDSKLKEPEFSIFKENTKNLKNIKFGTDDYKKHLKRVNTAIKHHYKENRHHPEHYENGIRDMNLLDLVEMFIDWKSSSEGYGSDINKNIILNAKRFGLSSDLEAIFLNSVDLFNKN